VTIISIVAFLTTLIASVIRVKGAPCRRPVVTGATRHPCGHLHSNPGAAYYPARHINHRDTFLPRARYTQNSILSVPRVFELHEGKPRRVPRDPHGSQGPVVAEGSLQLAFARARAQVPHV
ncbi:hypothetical protein N306_11565, partial [Opisthocomus hoazin]